MFLTEWVSGSPYTLFSLKPLLLLAQISNENSWQTAILDSATVSFHLETERGMNFGFFPLLVLGIGWLGGNNVDWFELIASSKINIVNLFLTSNIGNIIMNVRTSYVRRVFVKPIWIFFELYVVFGIFAFFLLFQSFYWEWMDTKCWYMGGRNSFSKCYKIKFCYAFFVMHPKLCSNLQLQWLA